jgi:hypothetical protein
VAVLVGLGAVFPRSWAVTCAAWVISIIVISAVLAMNPSERTLLSGTVIIAVMGTIYGIVVPTLLLVGEDTYLSGVDLRPYFSVASTTAACFVAAFAAGLHRRTSHDTLRAREANGRFLDGACVLFSLLAAVLVASWLVSGGSGRLRVLNSLLGAESVFEEQSGYLAYSPQMLVSSGWVLAVGSAHRTLRVVGWILATVGTLVLLFSGIRYAALVALSGTGILLIVSHYRGRKSGRPYPPQRLMWLGIPVALLFLGALGALRGAGAATTPLTRGAVDSAMVAFEISTPAAGAVYYVDENGWEFGRTYQTLLTAPIPRAWWPDKPASAIASVIGFFSDPREGRAFPIWSEAYVNAGFAGVLVLGFAAGRVWGRLQRWWTARSDAMSDVILAASFAMLVQFVSRGYLTQVVHNLAAWLMVPTVLTLISARSFPLEGRTGSRGCSR